MATKASFRAAQMSLVNRDMNSGWDLTSRVVLQPVTCLLYAMPSGLRTCGSQETTARMAVWKVVRTRGSETRQSGFELDSTAY